MSYTASMIFLTCVLWVSTISAWVAAPEMVYGFKRHHAVAIALTCALAAVGSIAAGMLFG